MDSLYLITFSLVWNSSLYFILKQYLVKCFCRNFLFDSIQLECDLKQIGKEHSYHGKKKIVAEGDVKAIAMELTASVMSTITSVVSVIVMVETRTDSMHSRSYLLSRWCHIISWYFLVDMCIMYDIYRTRNSISHLPVLHRCYRYVRAKWPYVVHHVMLFSFGYPIVVNDNWRGFKGDFYVGLIMAEEFTNPLISMAKVLKILGRNKTLHYLINGVLLVLIFFIVRIINMPIAVLIYAAQYHSWNIIEALYRLRLICYVSIALQYTIQVYWFMMMVKAALSTFSSLTANKPKLD